VVATTRDFAEIDLHWGRATDEGGEVRHYNVYRSTDPTCPPVLANLAGEARDLVFADMGLLADTTYYYTVTAVDRAGNEGPASAVASARTEPSDVPPMVLDRVDVAAADGRATVSVRVTDLSGSPVRATVHGRFTKQGGAYVTMPPTDADGCSSASSEQLKLPAGTVGFLPHRIVAAGHYWAGAYDRVHTAETTY
jgi:hypothetical protein